ncbi:MAG: DUF1697 domain-containing protein [Ignavibacteriota bacterium]|nr:MAG: DUF1697 domain-containing protein [Chlorobiota bacterium]MBE7475584.1 DUF1697 domain-containing protein [Ignavibacteriales bacterium]MBL1123106.1 DUF1697 domain-containing protein [Ignavibacteriota bacterium]MCC7092578.1 DUF1697 domain-containing protein [Ignavibacteriaceae bacterium]MCE7855681.1 DUF1697 domain-containing protein [Ignavibacteria bacterium CHB3]MEB2295922.1 DUF1697 domain-containing protein [Ignavibacteria bacterium]
MKKYIALLRGINVSGQKLIKMSELRTLFEKAGLQNVQTYIQSGNIIFSSKEKLSGKISQNISSAIKKKFGFDVHAIVLTPGELDKVILSNPFIKTQKESDKLYIIFLSSIPSKDNVNRIIAAEYFPEEYIVDGKCIYLFVPNGYGKAKLNNNFFENKLKVFGTTRNLKTLNALIELTKLH